MGRGTDIETSRTGRRVEDREMSPTSAGHPRCGDEDEAEGIRRRRNDLRGKVKSPNLLEKCVRAEETTWTGRPKFYIHSGRESCGRVGRFIRVSKKVFGRKLTATIDGEGGTHVLPITNVVEFAI